MQGWAICMDPYSEVTDYWCSLNIVVLMHIGFIIGIASGLY